MSGYIQYRVNRSWVDSSQTGVACFRVFWELLNFINDYFGYEFIAYGNETSQLGTTPPDSWFEWDDPPNYIDNNWFVFEAKNASALLNDDGTRPWQCKVQVYNSSSAGAGFNEPSGTDYGYKGEYQLICFRFSPDGDWSAGSKDFVPSSGADFSQNYCIYRGSSVDFGIHFIGDNDTIWFIGDIGSYIGTWSHTRGCYVGELVRRNSSHTKPELFMTGRIANNAIGTGLDAVIGRQSATNRAFGINQNTPWPSFSLAQDDLNEVTTHILGGLSSTFQKDLPLDPWSGNVELVSMMVRQEYSTINFSILGDLRFLRTCSDDYSGGTVLPDGNWIQIAEGYGTYGGIVMPWPNGVTPAW
jgi:hypothetical protein